MYDNSRGNINYGRMHPHLYSLENLSQLPIARQYIGGRRVST